MSPGFGPVVVGVKRSSDLGCGIEDRGHVGLLLLKKGVRARLYLILKWSAVSHGLRSKMTLKKAVSAKHLMSQRVKDKRVRCTVGASPTGRVRIHWIAIIKL